jgi:DNA-binding XRE family transcriptional regulator
MTPDDFRQWRKRLGWTQNDAAAKLGLSVRAIKHYESGSRGISPVVERLCRAVERGAGGKAHRRRNGNPAPSRIATPPRACRWLHDVISENYLIRSILDPCAGDGRLTKPWRNVTVMECEITRGFDFLALAAIPEQPDLVVCNPPFNNIRHNGSRLGSEVFLHKIVELTSLEQKIVLFAPTGFRLNAARRSARKRHLGKWSDHITSIVSLPNDFFPGVHYLTEILMFNMPKLKPHYSLR